VNEERDVSLSGVRSERAAHQQRGFRHGLTGEPRQPPPTPAHRTAYMTGYRAGRRHRLELAAEAQQ
jgi:ribosome modulation factor